MTLHYAGENYGIAREPVVQSESTRSGNQKLSTMERGGQKDGDCNLLGFVPALRFLRSQKIIISADSATVLRIRLMHEPEVRRTHTHANTKDHISALKIL